MRIIPPELKRAVKSNSLIVFAGAGVSVNCGFQDWKSLMHGMLSLIDQRQGTEVYKNFIPLLDENIVSPIEVLNILRTNGHTDIILQSVTRDLRLKANCRLDLHMKIIQLTSKIITTNYDRAFEQAWGIAPQVIHNDDPFSLWKLRDADEYLFKIHGDIEHPSRCVLFEHQYRELYEKEIFWVGFMNLLINNTLLFIGFSLTDPFVNEMLVKIKTMFEGLTNKHFIITTDKHIREALSDVIKPIVIDHYDEVIPMLDELMPVAHNLQPRPYGKFIRTYKVLEVLKSIKTSPLVIIRGARGTGKKSLALEAAYACLEKKGIAVSDQVRFTTIIWIASADICVNKSRLSAVYDIIGRAFDSEKVTKISNQDKWKKEYEVLKVLQENKTLILFDNFELLLEGEKDEVDDMVRWVQTLPQNCRLIINTTSDPGFTGDTIELDVLTRKEAVEFVSNEVSNTSATMGQFSDEELSDLYFFTKGKLSVLQLTAGQIKHGTAVKEIISSGMVDDPLKQLHDRAWEQQLSTDSKDFLLLLSVFDSPKPLEQESVHEVCKSRNISFETAVAQCAAFNLLVRIEDRQYLIPTQSRSYIKSKMTRESTASCRALWIKHFLEFVRRNAKRVKPNEPYWSALVTMEMKKIDQHWNAILEVLEWVRADQEFDAELIEFANMLVHYLDSRFYNELRLRIITSAIEAASRSNRLFEKALFLIDALGWTYIEESSFDEAKKTIKEGLLLAEDLKSSGDPNANDLVALGYSWLSRAAIEEDKSSEAFNLIQKAKGYQGKAWIKYRVHLAEGDLYVHEEKFDEALQCYESAKAEYDSYGGEGQDYQIGPRIGLAYLQNNKLVRAEEILRQQLNEHIPIGNLYAEYGLALISYKLGNKQDALKKLDEIESQIQKRASSNVLLKLIKAFRLKSSTA